MKKKIFTSLLCLAFFNPLTWAEDELTNASYRLAKDLYTEYNELFKAHWQEKTGKNPTLKLLNEAPETHIRAMKNGLKAEVATLIHYSDFDKLVDLDLVDKNWRQKFPNNASPYYSTIAFVVRKGNPKKIKDWGDLIKPRVSYIFPHPSTSRNARYSIMAALLYAREKYPTEELREEFMQDFAFHLATTSRGGSDTEKKFIKNKFIDALLTFESEAYHIKNANPEQEFEVVVPQNSILAQFPVAIIDKVVNEKGNRELAQEYLNYLYDPKIQDLLVQKYHYRVNNEELMNKYADKFPKVSLKSSDEIDSWEKLSKIWFSYGGKWQQFTAEVD